MIAYRLLDRFQQLFDGVKYRHRVHTNGDKVARCLYEDLYDLGRSKSFVARVKDHRSGVSTQNRRRGVRARRGDGTFGELIPSVVAVVDTGFSVPRGEIATVEIGVEVKIFSKAMVKQLGRVENDLRDQVKQFQTRATNPVCVGFVGLNYAPHCVGYEGERSYLTDGSPRYRHPVQESPQIRAAVVYGS